MYFDKIIVQYVFNVGLLIRVCYMKRSSSLYSNFVLSNKWCLLIWKYRSNYYHSKFRGLWGGWTMHTGDRLKNKTSIVYSMRLWDQITILFKVKQTSWNEITFSLYREKQYYLCYKVDLRNPSTFRKLDGNHTGGVLWAW